MTEAKKVTKHWPQLSYVPRSTAVAPQKPTLFPNDKYTPSTIKTGEPIPQQINQTTVLSSNSPSDDTDIVKHNKTSSPVAKKTSLEFDNIKSEKPNEQQSSNALKKWFNHLTSKQKIVFVSITGVLLTAAVAAAVIPPVYLFVIKSQSKQESSSTNTTSSICSSTTCIGKETPYQTSMITALYPFDGNPSDLTGYSSGISFGSASPPYSGSAYIGTYSMSCPLTASQYIQIPYVDLTQSFTIEIWVNPTSNVAEYGIFGQCDFNSKCLSISLRNARYTLSFDSMDASNIPLVSTTLTSTSRWTHLAVVYDSVLLQQKIYINGRMDAMTLTTVAPYGGSSSGSITTIGRTTTYVSGTTFFYGRLDHLTISAGTVRTACQILNDASLVAYYPFESPMPFNDRSANLFHGVANAVTTVSHDSFGQALYFSSSTSYFQATCFPNMAMTIIPFSISVWIKPDSITGGGSVVHISSSQYGNNTCYDLLAFTSTGTIVIQLMQTASIVNGIEGPVLAANTWTHVAIVYGTGNNLRVYINGQLSTLSNSFLQSGTIFNSPQYVILGNNNLLDLPGFVNCRNGLIPYIAGPFQGAIDEFRLYNRELDAEEVCVLANL